MISARLRQKGLDLTAFRPSVLSGQFREDGRQLLRVYWPHPLAFAFDPLPVSIYTPTNGAAPAEKTEVLVAYDDLNFYAAALCYDRKIGNMVTRGPSSSGWTTWNSSPLQGLG